MPKSKGKIFVVGLGPGNQADMTPRALEALERCDVILGYSTYVTLIAPIFQAKGQEEKLRPSAMRQEKSRCYDALSLALEGYTVGLISSGDAGVYGMAGPMLETIADRDVDVEIIPGITALLSSAALLGAPLIHDFAVISLSDLLTPWDLIERRLLAAAEADFVICLYNPVSNGRPKNLSLACEILLRRKAASTPAGWVRNVGRIGASSKIMTLEELKAERLDMFCTVIIGNSCTRVCNNRMLTPRGYLPSLETAEADN